MTRTTSGADKVEVSPVGDKMSRDEGAGNFSGGWPGWLPVASNKRAESSLEDGQTTSDEGAETSLADSQMSMDKGAGTSLGTGAGS